MKTILLKPTAAWLLLALILVHFHSEAEIAVQSWVQRFTGLGSGDDWAMAIIVDSLGNAIVAGSVTNSASGRDYVTIKYSEAGAPLWTNVYNGPGNGNDWVQAVAVDGTNNVIVTGSSEGNGSRIDFATIKYSTAGEPLWTNRYNGPGNDNDQPSAIAVDGNGDVFLTGYSFDSVSVWAYATVKYSGAGAPLWTNRYHRPGNGLDYARKIVVDHSGDVIVTGSSQNGIARDYVTIKYSRGGVPLWTNSYNGLGNGTAEPNGIAVDGSNNVVVTGSSIDGGSSNDCATIKYSSGGVPLWTNRYNGPGNGTDRGNAIAVDGNNDVLVAGQSAGIGTTNDCVTIKYSSEGALLWVSRYDGPGHSFDSAMAVVVDRNNDVVVTGPSAGSGTYPDFYDYATIKYSSAGIPLWTNRYNGPGNGADYASAVAVDTNGNVFVTGRSTAPGSGLDWTTIKYSILRPIPLEIQPVENQLMLSWTNAAFRLQSAPDITVTFTNIPGATSPYTNPITAAQQFFRLISN